MGAGLIGVFCGVGAAGFLFLMSKPKSTQHCQLYILYKLYHSFFFFANQIVEDPLYIILFMNKKEKEQQ
jgi:hypothetical protein